MSTPEKAPQRRNCFFIEYAGNELNKEVISLLFHYHFLDPSVEGTERFYLYNCFRIYSIPVNTKGDLKNIDPE
jgi:hypothetical protein